METVMVSATSYLEVTVHAPMKQSSVGKQLRSYKRMWDAFQWEASIGRVGKTAGRHHRYRPGTLNLQEIQQDQKTTDLMIHQRPFIGSFGNFSNSWADLIFGSCPQLSMNCKKLWRLLLLVSLKTPTCVLSMQSRSQSCARICSWPCALVVGILSHLWSIYSHS